MAHYFSLTPIGVGTLEAECFPSYLCRLAKLHGVTTAEFCTHLSNWWKLRGSSPALPGGRLYDLKASSLCSTQPTLQTYLSAVSEGVGQDGLEKTTLLAIAPAISTRTSGLVRRGRAWCPACFLEHLNHGSEAYDRLLWALCFVERCPIHGLRLESVCPQCGVAQRFVDSSCDMGICYRCHENLASRPSGWSRADKPGFGERDCCELVEAICEDDFNVVDSAPMVYIRELKRIMDLSEGGTAFKEFARRSLLPWTKTEMERRERPSFPVLLRMCSATGVRLIDVLSDPWSSARMAGELFRFEATVFEKTFRGDLFHQKVGKWLRTELAKPSERRLAPYGTVLRMFSVSDGYMRHRFPALANEYRQRCHDETEADEARLAEKVREWLTENMVHYPSRYRRQKELAAAAAKACGCGVRFARMSLSRIRHARATNWRSVT